MRGAGWVEVGAQGKLKSNGKANGKHHRSADNEPDGAEKRGSSIYGRTALKAECDKLAAIPKDSGRNNALNSAAFNLFQLVAGGELDEEKDQVAERLFAAAEARQAVIYVPTAVMWETSLLSRVGRIDLRRSLRQFFADLFTNPAYRALDLIAEDVDLASDARPNDDPFDALVCAAARRLSLPLLTRDADIAESGLVRVIWS